MIMALIEFFPVNAPCIILLVGWLTIVCHAEEPLTTIEFDQQEIEFEPSRADLTVGIAILNILAPDDDWNIILSDADKERFHDRSMFKEIELRQLGSNQFELPQVTFEASDDQPGPLCLGLKVWFHEIPNEYDSPFYVNTPDRYSLVSYCTEDHRQARARHRQNRVKTLAEFRARLEEPFKISLRDHSVPWYPSIFSADDGALYFHSFFVGNPNKNTPRTHLRGIWTYRPDERLETIALPDLRRISPWPQRIQAAGKDRYVAAAILSFSATVAMDKNGYYYVAVRESQGRGQPVLYRIARFDSKGDREIIAGSTVGYVDGPADSAQFQNITALAVAPDGTIFVADGNPKSGSRVRKVAAGGVTTIAGGDEVGFSDGPAEDARFWCPSGLAKGHEDILYIADPVNGKVRTLSETGRVASLELQVEDSDATLEHPCAVAITPDGTLLILDAARTQTRIWKFNGKSLSEVVSIHEGTK